MMISMKFGGTSMGSAENILKVAEIIKNAAKTDKKPIVTVSAMSGVTDLLLKAADLSAQGEEIKTREIVEKIKLKHLEAIEKMIKDKDRQKKALQYLENEVALLLDLLGVVEILGEMPTRAHDAIVAMGEKFSAKLLSIVLKDQDTEAKYLNLERIIDEKNANPDEEFFLRIQKNIAEKISKALDKGRIPILTGFIGKIPLGIVNSLGRGYSDYTAALTGAALNVDRLEIWTDVDGIFTADPRIIKAARIVCEVSYEEASQMAHFGAKVLHPRTINPVVKAGIPTYILNTFNPSAPGTCIKSDVTEKSIKSITSKRHISIINASSNRKFVPHEFMARVFFILAKYKIQVDAVSVTQASISFATCNGKELSKAKKELTEISHLTVDNDNALIAVVGSGMKGRSGLAGEIFSTLGEKKLNIEMISQGSSEINITFLLDEQHTEDVVKSLHKKLFE